MVGLSTVLNDAHMGQKQFKHSEVNVVLQSINQTFPAFCNFFVRNYERFERLNPQQFLWRRRRGMLVTT